MGRRLACRSMRQRVKLLQANRERSDSSDRCGQREAFIVIHARSGRVVVNIVVYRHCREWIHDNGNVFCYTQEYIYIYVMCVYPYAARTDSHTPLSHRFTAASAFPPRETVGPPRGSELKVEDTQSVPDTELPTLKGALANQCWDPGGGRGERYMCGRCRDTQQSRATYIRTHIDE